VLGSGAVYVLDGSSITYSGLSEAHAEGVLSIHGVTLHVLGKGAQFDLEQRQPLNGETHPPETDGR
jgi:cyanophycinase